MNIVRLIIRETLHTKINFLLSLLAVVIGVSLYVYSYTTGLASNRETIRLMRDIGYNLRIIPASADMNKFWIEGYTDETMPQEYVYRFADQNALSYNHLLAVLHKKIDLNGTDILLTGISQEVRPPDKGGSSMIFSISEGSVYLGYEISKSLEVRENDEIMILGKILRIEKCLPENGSIDDIRIYGRLEDVQDMLNLNDRINEIKALECLCHDPSLDTRDVIRSQLAKLIPDAKVVQISTIARAREKQRKMIDNYFAYILPLVIITCGGFIGILSLMNVRERNTEIGILRALGYKSGKIFVLFLGKSTYLGILGSVIGFVLGTILAVKFGHELFPVTATAIKPVYDLFLILVLITPACTSVSGFLPAVVAVSQEPAKILRGE